MDVLTGKLRHTGQPILLSVPHIASICRGPKGQALIRMSNGVEYDLIQPFEEIENSRRDINV